MRTYLTSEAVRTACTRRGADVEGEGEAVEALRHLAMALLRRVEPPWTAERIAELAPLKYGKAESLENEDVARTVEQLAIGVTPEEASPLTRRVWLHLLLDQVGPALVAMGETQPCRLCKEPAVLGTAHCVLHLRH